MIHVEGAAAPSMANQKWQTAWTATSSSWLKVLSQCSAGVIGQLVKASGHHLPMAICSKAAPMPTLEASVCTQGGIREGVHEEAGIRQGGLGNVESSRQP